jgi:hypothetical protein
VGAADVEAIGDFVDRRQAIEQIVKDDETPIVYLEFTPQGRWRGISYYLASGNGCGYCTSEVASTVKLSNGRLIGNVKGTERDRPFNVTLDVAVLSDDHGAVLPADGGAPGKAYLALSRGARQARCAGDQAHALAGESRGLRRRAEEERSRQLSLLSGREATDEGGEDHARLGDADQGVAPRRRGIVGREVFLINSQGKWGVDEELVDLVLGR